MDKKLNALLRFLDTEHYFPSFVMNDWRFEELETEHCIELRVFIDDNISDINLIRETKKTMIN